MAIAQYSFYVKHTTMALLMRLNAPRAVTAESKFLSLSLSLEIDNKEG